MMIPTTVSAAIDAKVTAQAMLSHPFYQAWTDGTLPLDTLRQYARQYFHHVEAFPRARSARPRARAVPTHPFCQAWTDGTLPLDTLRQYARQYFHHVEAFPRAVSAVHSACPDRDGRRMLAENLAEEEGLEAGKQDHASLWMMFACGLGESETAVREQALNDETRALIDTFRRLSRTSYASGLGALY